MKKLFDFGEALKALKGSCCVARQGWMKKVDLYVNKYLVI